MGRRPRKTPHSTGSSHDWNVTRAWRRMFLALVDAGTPKARMALRYSARCLAGRAESYAPGSEYAAQARESARDAATCSACVFKALSFALMALRGSSPDPDADLCDLFRSQHPDEPPTFAQAGQHSRDAGGGYVPVQYDLPRP